MIVWGLVAGLSGFAGPNMKGLPWHEHASEGEKCP